jgi:hypothetical protein
LLDSLYGGKFPIGISLGIVAVVIAASIVLSLILPKNDDYDDIERSDTTVNDQTVQLVVHKPKKHIPMQKLIWKSLGVYILLVGLALIVALALAY